MVVLLVDIVTVFVQSSNLANIAIDLFKITLGRNYTLHSKRPSQKKELHIVQSESQHNMAAARLPWPGVRVIGLLY
jgi:hypothetical protein